MESQDTCLFPLWVFQTMPNSQPLHAAAARCAMPELVLVILIKIAVWVSLPWWDLVESNSVIAFTLYSPLDMALWASALWFCGLAPASNLRRMALFVPFIAAICFYARSVKELIALFLGYGYFALIYYLVSLVVGLRGWRWCLPGADVEADRRVVTIAKLMVLTMFIAALVTACRIEPEAATLASFAVTVTGFAIIADCVQLAVSKTRYNLWLMCLALLVAIVSLIAESVAAGFTSHDVNSVSFDLDHSFLTLVSTTIYFVTVSLIAAAAAWTSVLNDGESQRVAQLLQFLETEPPQSPDSSKIEHD